MPSHRPAVGRQTVPELQRKAKPARPSTPKVRTQSEAETADQVPGHATSRAARPAQSHLAKKAKEPREGKEAKPARAEPKAAAGKEAAARAAAPRRPGPGTGQVQAAALEEFNAALALVGKRDWKGAAERLRAILAAHPGEFVLLDRVRTYLKVAERELHDRGGSPTSPEEHYQAGVLQLNAGELDQAAGHFQRAVAAAPQLDKAHYALGAALAQKGDLASALQSLRRAVELEPENRVYLANDSDLEPLRDDPGFIQLAALAPRPARPRGAPAAAPAHGADESE